LTAEGRRRKEKGRLMMDMTGNMYWRADWKVCAEYQPGDVVSRAGDLYLAIEQNAGLDPADPLNTKYWRLINAAAPMPILKHNDLEEKQGGNLDAGEFYHLAKNEQEAAANATEPSATNPFLTEKDMPYLEKRVTDWTLAVMPEGVGALYDVVWDGVFPLFCGRWGTVWRPSAPTGRRGRRWNVPRGTGAGSVPPARQPGKAGGFPSRAARVPRRGGGVHLCRRPGRRGNVHHRRRQDVERKPCPRGRLERGGLW
jgi:hypothetical protein